MTWDVIVVGGGVLGTFHALFAAQQGWKTLLIERTDTARGASVRNFGMVIGGAMEPGVWRQRALSSSAIYRDLAARVPFPFVRSGIQYVGSTDAEVQVLEEFAGLAPSLGYRCRLQHTGEACGANPILKQAYCKAALFFPDDFTVDSRSLFKVLHAWIVEHLGCSLLTNTEVIAVRRAGDLCEIQTSEGQTFRSRSAIVCSGDTMRSLFPVLFKAQALISCKLQMMRTVRQPRLTMPAALALGLSLRRYGAFKLAPSFGRLVQERVEPFLEENGIHVLLTQNPAGEVIIGDSHQSVQAGREHDEQLDMRIDDAILAYARRAVDLPTWHIASRWFGTYAVCPGDQYLHEVVDGLIHVVNGIGGKGMTCGPGLAREHIEQINSQLFS